RRSTAENRQFCCYPRELALGLAGVQVRRQFTAEGEASAGECIGQPLSREISNRDADAFVTAEGNTGVRVNASILPVPRGRRPWHVQTLLVPAPGDLTPGRRREPTVRVGKATSRSRG